MPVRTKLVDRQFSAGRYVDFHMLHGNPTRVSVVAISRVCEILSTTLRKGIPLQYMTLSEAMELNGPCTPFLAQGLLDMKALSVRCGTAPSHRRLDFSKAWQLGRMVFSWANRSKVLLVSVEQPNQFEVGFFTFENWETLKRFLETKVAEKAVSLA